MSPVVLEVRGLRRRFGGVAALDGVDLELSGGEVRCLIGPNGAGKTTFVNALTGLVAPEDGVVRFDGEEITRLAAAAIARRGVLRTFQTPTVFPRLSMRVNLELGARRGRRGAPPQALRRAVVELAAQLGLNDRLDDPAIGLSHGEKKRVELGMVLAADPRLVLLDEPTAGMGVAETAELAELLRTVCAGRTLLVIEHDMAFVRAIADRVSVMHRGRILTEGSIDEVEADQTVRDVYLGEVVG
jgi:ABC-type uncharacterized transport system ATPase subunit